MVSRRVLLNTLVSGAAGASLLSAKAMAQAPDPSGERPTPRTFGAVGDGETDDSDAWNRFIAHLMSTGQTGFVPAATYAVPGAAPTRLTAPLRLVGEPGTIIDGQGKAAGNQFEIVASSVELFGLEFRNFSDLIVAGDAGEGSFGSAWTGEVDLIAIERCRFVDVRRPLTCRGTDNGPPLKNLRLVDNLVDGGKVGWSGFHIGVHNLGSAVVTGNIIRNIDATAAGGSPPANIGNGRAILLGGNNPPDTFAHGRWIITANVIENITDSRSRSSNANPEVGGIRATGGAHCVISDNTLFNINSTGGGIDADCEGIYVKTPLSTITGNTLRNAGRTEGAICVKGANKAGDLGGNNQSRGWGSTIAHNVLWTDFGERTVGIGVQTSHAIIESNQLTGFGGDNNRWVPILIDAAQQDETKVRNNTVLDTAGRFGIRMMAYGRDIEIIGNTIRGVTGAALAKPAQTYGIQVDNSNGNKTNVNGVPLANLRIEGNTIGGLANPGGLGATAITVTSAGSDCTDLVIARNVIADPVTSGISLSGSGRPFNKVTVIDNDLRQANRPWGVSGSGVSVVDLIARGNRGWLYAELVYDPPEIGPGDEVHFDIPMDDLVFRDSVQVGWSAQLTQNGQGVRVSWEVFKPDPSGAPDAYAVRVYLRNPNETYINLGSRTWYARAEKMAS